jgi:hypothetical protein
MSVSETLRDIKDKTNEGGRDHGTPPSLSLFLRLRFHFFHLRSFLIVAQRSLSKKRNSPS